MDIGRRLLALGLFAVLPALGSAQEPKLINCRTLEAAGNFVGPDEVIVDDMVCQKVKPGADVAAKQAVQKQVIGTVVSDAPADNVVEAAKAAEKRVADRREQDKNAISGAVSAFRDAALSATPREASESSSAATPVAAVAPPQSTMETAAEAAKQSTLAPSAVPPTSAGQAEVSRAGPAPPAAGPGTAAGKEAAALAEPAPQPSPGTKLETELPAKPAPSALAAAAASEPANTASSEPATAEVVISSKPASVAAPAPPSDSTPAAVPVTLEPTAAPSVRAPAPVPAGGAEAEPVDPSHPGTSGGFYDANAPKHTANSAPETNTGFASAEQVNAGLTPGATSVPRPASSTSNAAPDSPATPAEPEAETEHTTIAASRIDFDADRDRSVKLGDFAKPHEVSPDPNAEHRTSVDPSAEDGFQDRQRPDCTKNVTLAGLSGEKLVLGVPSWAARWIEKNEKRTPQICFSETPMKSARNYLVVFSTPAGQVSKEAADAAVNPVKGPGAAGVGTFTTLYGSTWHYSFDRNVGTTILTLDDADEPHGAPGQVLYATAYTEEGVPVAQRWPGQPKKEVKPSEKNSKKLKGETEALEHVSGDLLGQMVEDIGKL